MIFVQEREKRNKGNNKGVDKEEIKKSKKKTTPTEQNIKNDNNHRSEKADENRKIRVEQLKIDLPTMGVGELRRLMTVR